MTPLEGRAVASASFGSASFVAPCMVASDVGTEIDAQCRALLARNASDSAGDRKLGVAIDLDAGRIKFGQNGRCSYYK